MNHSNVAQGSPQGSPQSVPQSSLKSHKLIPVLKNPTVFYSSEEILDAVELGYLDDTYGYGPGEINSVDFPVVIWDSGETGTDGQNILSHQTNNHCEFSHRGYINILQNSKDWRQVKLEICSDPKIKFVTFMYKLDETAFPNKFSSNDPEKAPNALEAFKRNLLVENQRWSSLDQFHELSFEQYLDELQPEEYINMAFNWSNSPEGFPTWIDINNRWEFELNQNEPQDDQDSKVSGAKR